MSFVNNLPPRWKRCPRIGDMIADMFIPFKTPLNDKFLNALEVDEVFTPECLFEAVKPFTLGIVIDLTKTKRFYDRREIEKLHSKYVKIECKGNEETPTLEQVNLFLRIVDSFNDTKKGEMHKIGVHCTHGFNRTGFLIVAYLVERANYSVDAAVDIFAAARPPGIYKQDYLNELFERYGDPEDCPSAPELPDWCDESETGDKSSASIVAGSKRSHADDDDLGGDDEVDQSEDASRQNKHAARSVLPPAPYGTPKFMERVTGVVTIDQNSLEAHEARQLADYFCDMGGFTFSPDGDVLPAKQKDEETTDVSEDPLSLSSSKSKPPQSHASSDGLEPIKVNVKSRNRPVKFRGSQPVSMDLQNIARVLNMPYSVSYKADGTRYLLLIRGKGQVYLIDRGNFVYKPECLQFPSMHYVHVRSSGKGEYDESFLDDEFGHLANSLLDGEMVMIENQSGARCSHFLIYDVIAMYDRSYGHRLFVDRYNAIDNHVIRPRECAMQQGWMQAQDQVFPVSRKKFLPITHLEKLLDPYLEKKLGMETDGIIFQPCGPKDRYMLGTCPTTLKWKPPELNSVDFLCKVQRMNKPGCLPEIVADLFLGGQNTYCIRLDRRPGSDLQYDNKIVECTYDFGINSWKFLRVRTDKTEPNHVTSGKSVVNSILRPVTKNHLLQLLHQIVSAQAKTNSQAPANANVREAPSSNPRQPSQTSSQSQQPAVHQSVRAPPSSQLSDSDC